MSLYSDSNLLSGVFKRHDAKRFTTNQCNKRNTQKDEVCHGADDGVSSMRKSEMSCAEQICYIFSSCKHPHVNTNACCEYTEKYVVLQHMIEGFFNYIILDFWILAQYKQK